MSSDAGSPVGRRVFLGPPRVGRRGGGDGLDAVRVVPADRQGRPHRTLVAAARRRGLALLHGDRRLPEPHALPSTGCTSVGSSTGRSPSATTSSPPCRPTRLDRDFQCVTGWRVHRRQVAGRPPRRPPRPRRGPARGHGAPVHDASTARTPRASRSSRPDDSDVIVAYQTRRHADRQRSRRPGPPLRRADVRLQVGEVARQHRGDPQGRSRATGRNAATTSTRWVGESNGRER